jgi:Protein of unknown function (DUF4038)
MLRFTTPRECCHSGWMIDPRILTASDLAPCAILHHVWKMHLMRPFAIVLSLIVVLSANAAPLPHLKVSENKRFLVYENGRPFFYLGDTAWELFHRLNREEADTYLEDRAKKGFTVIQAVAIAELDGHSDPNPYGHLPLADLDPAKPSVKDGPTNDYWDHVDYIVRKANDRGMQIGFLPTWGR